MIAQNIAHAAVLAGTHVLFTTAAQLLLDLGSQESTRALTWRLNHYVTRPLLVIDEVGYLFYDGRAADLLLQVVTRRYEKRSLVLTTNVPFSEWPIIFPNAGSAIALVDRLVHHAPRDWLPTGGRETEPCSDTLSLTLPMTPGSMSTTLLVSAFASSFRDTGSS
jgi:DNA replication protein DnaC